MLGSGDFSNDDSAEERSVRGSAHSPNPEPRLSFMSTASSEPVNATVFELEQEMVDLLREADEIVGQPRADDHRFIEDICGRIMSDDDAFGSEQLQEFMLESLGLPTDSRSAERIVREMVRYPAMASENDDDRRATRGSDMRVSRENFCAWWDVTALTARAVSAMSAADDLRRGLRLLGLLRRLLPR